MTSIAPISRLLVANRGEIAVRIFRTCRRLGIATVAVAPADDAGSLHARSADEVVAIASYLDADEIVRAARESGADAVHPGYGFLAESATLADAVLAGGVIWVGPPPEALRLGGDKLAAKRIAAEADVPTVPQGSAAELGFPVLVKAAAGGGGRGMRIVHSPDDLEEALVAAAREAEAAFGDGTVFCERYLEHPRHIEVQLLADESRARSFGLRDCSVQRRHQKVVEESPPPALAPSLAAAIEAAAVRFAESIGYRSAGTAEFLVAGDDFYFLELNGRIQVEHPVTEAVTGLDLVELQLRIAAGATVDVEVSTNGHAAEARLYAEDPRGFLPQAGTVERLALPAGVRVDAGVAEGDEVGVSYDPLIAKLIAHGVDRDEALDRLARALDETVVEGVLTNLPFLRWLVGHPVFRAGGVSTSFLEEFPPLSAPPYRLPTGPYAGGWRLNLPSPRPRPRPDADVEAYAHPAGGGGSVLSPMPGTVVTVPVSAGDVVSARQPLVVLEAMKMELPVTAPFDGKVASIHVAPGERVAGGQLLVELESPR